MSVRQGLQSNETNYKEKRRKVDAIENWELALVEVMNKAPDGGNRWSGAFNRSAIKLFTQFAVFQDAKAFVEI